MNTLLSLCITLLPLILGLVAWGFSLAAVFGKKKSRLIPSWLCCACTLWFPLQAICRWVENGDIAAVLDCAGAYFHCASVLLAVNLLLSGLYLLRKHAGQSK